MKRFLKSVAGTVAVVAGLTAASAANAALQVAWRTSSAGSFSTCTDNQGCDSQAGLGSILLLNLDNDWLNEISVSTSSGGTAPMSVSLNFQATSGNVIADYFEIWLTQTDIAVPVNQPLFFTADLGISSAQSATTNGFQYTAWWDNNGSALYGRDNLILDASFDSATDDARRTVSGTDAGGAVTVTQRFIFQNASNATNLSVTGTIDVAVPVPGTLALLGLGLAGVGLLRHRRRA